MQFGMHSLLYNFFRIVGMEEQMASFLAAIDQGTTSTRFIVFDFSGNIVAAPKRS
jgi:hypothetical protein